MYSRSSRESYRPSPDEPGQSFIHRRRRAATSTASTAPTSWWSSLTQALDAQDAEDAEDGGQDRDMQANPIPEDEQDDYIDVDLAIIETLGESFFKEMKDIVEYILPDRRDNDSTQYHNPRMFIIEIEPGGDNEHWYYKAIITGFNGKKARRGDPEEELLWSEDEKNKDEISAMEGLMLLLQGKAAEKEAAEKEAEIIASRRQKRGKRSGGG